MYKQFQLVGFKQVTLLMFTSSLTSHFVTAVLIVFTDRIIRSNIFAKMNSSDASSMMLGFRQVLRGVCDGDLLLDKSSCSIVDDASCLERLLKSSKKLSKTNFLDLFLDSESRQRFLHFLSSDPEATPAMPRGLRLALQGADGLVSIDVFHTQVSNQGATGNDYCLLASLHCSNCSTTLFFWIRWAFSWPLLFGSSWIKHIAHSCPLKLDDWGWKTGDTKALKEDPEQSSPSWCAWNYATNYVSEVWSNPISM